MSGQQQQGKVEVDEEGVRESIRLAREALDLAGKLHRKGTHQVMIVWYLLSYDIYRY